MVVLAVLQLHIQRLVLADVNIMIKFFNKHDEELYNHLVENHNEFKSRKWKVRVYDYLEVDEFEGIKMFHWPTSISWCRFYGTFEELHDKLKEDMPDMCPDVKFYREVTSPICI